MKKILLGTILCATLSLPLMGKNVVRINKLVKCTTSSASLADQIMLEFTRSLYYEKEVSSKGEEVTLSFPGIDLNQFRKHAVDGKIRNIAFVKNVVVEYQKNPIPRVVVKISFDKDKVILRFGKTEDPNLLIIDVFNKSRLDLVLKRSSTTLLACNDSVLNDYSFFPGEVKKKLNCSLKKKINIVIDAGHGGKDVGAHAFKLKEKDLTLDIARRVCAELKQKGYSAFLTRNTDTFIPLVDRFQLAHQLQADLFISIHVNSFPGGEYVSGIETHYLDSNSYFDQHKRSGYAFVDNAHDKKLADIADRILREKIDSSKLLSENLQTNLISTLKKQKMHVKNRGTKRTSYRSLLRSEAPAAIVEVGFLTNKQEAKQLGKKKYRSLIAKSLSNGIFDYIKAKS
jgi:N-acetylmuramoyl-L-alanine amidase